MRTPFLQWALSTTVSVFCSSAFAWGADGHHTVGAIADRLIAGTPAAQKVSALLGGLSLQDAAVWADCAKGIDPAKDFAYTSAGKYPECKVFETPEREAEMSDYVRRNDTNCPRQAGDESCHKSYHYTDVALQRSAYVRGTIGTRDFDVVAAISAATQVLMDKPAPRPFDIKDKREALLLIAHFIGDIHQPLHVGAVYLAANGTVVDPDAAAFDPATETRGGNEIITIREATRRRGANLHQTWDDIPESLMSPQVDSAWLKLAGAVPRSKGDADAWSTGWASETLTRAKSAFSGLTFGAQQAAQWTTTLPYAYDAKMEPIKKKALTAAGARLAQLLQTIWP